MKKLNLLVLFIGVFTLSSCLKSGDDFDFQAQFELEKPLIRDYVETNIPAATLHENTGIWFEVLAPGDEDSYEYKRIGVSGPVESPIIKVKYTLRLLNGTTVETQESYEQSLGNLLEAWHIAFLPKTIDGQSINGLTTTGLKKGSKIRFVTPSLWGYRNVAQGNVPANSPLDFVIEVLDIRPPSNPN